MTGHAEPAEPCYPVLSFAGLFTPAQVREWRLVPERIVSFALADAAAYRHARLQASPSCGSCAGADLCDVHTWDLALATAYQELAARSAES